MNHKNRWALAMLTVASLLLSACAQKMAAANKIPPAQVSPIEGTNLKRLTLTADAAKRLDIKTTAVREEPHVRTRRFGGEVVGLPIATSASESSTVVTDSMIWVRVSLSESDKKKVLRDEPAQVLPLTRLNPSTGGPAPAPVPALTALSVEAPTLPGADPTTELYYSVEGADHSLVVGQRVLLELTLEGSRAMRKIIPFSAVVYDKNGNAWTYTNPEPLVFIRHAVTIDYIDGDWAILTEGPIAGTAVASSGASELYGAEVGVGK